MSQVRDDIVKKHQADIVLRYFI